MKKQIFFPAFLVAIFLWSGNIQAQVEDVANPLLKYVNRNNGLMYEDSVPKAAAQNALDKIFKTQTGKTICKEMFVL